MTHSQPVPEATPSAESGHFQHVRRQLYVNSGLLGLSRFLSTCTSLVTVPVVLTRLGMSGYGTWESMMAIAALITVFQTTISGTLIWKMSTAYGSSDSSQIHRLMGIGLGSVFTMFALISPLSWLLRYQLVAVANPPTQYRDAALLVIPILISQTTLGACGETFAAVLIAHQRAGISTLIQTAALMANSLFMVVGLMRGWQLWSLLLGNTVGVAAAIAGQYFAVVAMSGFVSVRPVLPNRAEAMPLFKYASFLALGLVSSALRDQTDKLVLASVGSTVWTAWFGLASRLANLTLVVCSFFYVPLVSAVAALAARGDWAGVRRLYADTMLGMPYLAGCFVVLMACTYDRVLMLWIGRSVPEVGPILFILLAGNITAVALTGVGSSLCKGIGKVSIETTYIIICVVANVVLKFILTPWLGPIGAVLSSATSWTLGSVVFLILLHRSVDLPRTAYRAAAMLPVMFVTVLMIRSVAGSVPATTTRLGSAVAASGIGLTSIALFTALLIVGRILPWEIVRGFGRSLYSFASARLGVRYGS